MQLQRAVGNRALQRLLEAPAAAGSNLHSSSGGCIQRLIITEHLETDKEYQRVIRFLVEKAGVAQNIAAPGEKKEITKTKPDEPIYILLHGSKPDRANQFTGTVNFWSPADLLGILNGMGFEPAKHTGNIKLLSCHSAFTMKGEASFALRFAKLLQEEDYPGTVSGVTGSLNPFDIGDAPQPIVANNLWQGDPIYARMDEMSTVMFRISQTGYDIEDFISGTNIKVDLNSSIYGIIDDALYVIEVSTFTIGTLDDQEYRTLLGDWKKDFIDNVQKIMDVYKQIKAAKVTNQDPVMDTISQLIDQSRMLIDRFETIKENYCQKRVTQGYRQGLLGGLFQPFQL